MQVVTTMLLAVVGLAEPEANSRYGVALDLKSYPQATAREALGSLVKALKANRFEYLVAQLADPAFIDERINRLYGGKFAEQVEDTRSQFDPATIKLFERFLKEGTVAADKGQATWTLKDVEGRCIHLRESFGRWYLEHRFKPGK